MTDLKAIQTRVGVTPDGIWGARTAAAIAKALGMVDQPRSLTNEPAFYATVRAGLFVGTMNQAQVDGIARLLKAFGEARWGIAWAAYGLATSYWETARTMTPVVEGYFLGGKAGARHRAALRYAPWWGRGDVQLTWEKNYRLADKELGLGGALVLDPEMALRPDISAKVICRGMEFGWFTGKKLGHFLPANAAAETADFVQARKIINGTDKNDEIAAIAAHFQVALERGGWA